MIYNIESIIRKLARSWEFQTLYRNKDLVKIFKNEYPYTKLQLMFLYWLDIYKNLYEIDGYYEVLPKHVIEDDIRVDAFLYHRKYKIKLEREAEEFRKKFSNRGNVNFNSKDAFEFEFKTPKKMRR